MPGALLFDYAERCAVTGGGIERVGNYGVEVPQLRGSDEISHLSQRFSDMASKLAESEQLSRNFLMSVSHELRTPLTAIRGHISALREGVIEDPDLRSASMAVIEEDRGR